MKITLFSDKKQRKKVVLPEQVKERVQKLETTIDVLQTRNTALKKKLRL
jgi:hypothetical protein